MEKIKDVQLIRNIAVRNSHLWLASKISNNEDENVSAEHAKSKKWQSLNEEEGENLITDWTAAIKLTQTKALSLFYLPN